jgi:glycosyltransferase involved in cell wall biosynthesis
LCETNHHLFYDNYTGPKIAYNVWESTLQPEGYFNKLKEFDELWVPSKWQRDCTIAQGMTRIKLKLFLKVLMLIHFTLKHQISKDRSRFCLCARSEGWNLPLIESMACGTPSIYSECSAQMEFADGKGFPVKVIGERSADSNDYGRYKMSELPGNYYEPDFEHLSEVMRYTYEIMMTVKTSTY